MTPLLSDTQERARISANKKHFDDPQEHEAAWQAEKQRRWEEVRVENFDNGLVLVQLKKPMDFSACSLNH